MALFRRKAKTERLVTVELNARLQPLDRGEHFEDPLIAHLEAMRLPAEVDGGGTLTSAEGEPERSDIELVVTGGDPMPVVASVVIFLTQIGAPKGSRLLDGGRLVTELGTHEGLALYLNGTDLPDEVYATSDVNELVEQVRAALGDSGRVLSHWEGPRETALYLYGPTAETMREQLAPVIASHPLAQQSRLVDLT